MNTLKRNHVMQMAGDQVRQYYGLVEFLMVNKK